MHNHTPQQYKLLKTYRQKAVYMLQQNPGGLTCAEICNNIQVQELFAHNKTGLSAVVSSVLTKMYQQQIIKRTPAGPRGGYVYKLTYQC